MFVPRRRFLLGVLERIQGLERIEPVRQFKILVINKVRTFRGLPDISHHFAFIGAQVIGPFHRPVHDEFAQKLDPPAQEEMIEIAVDIFEQAAPDDILQRHLHRLRAATLQNIPEPGTMDENIPGKFSVMLDKPVETDIFQNAIRLKDQVLVLQYLALRLHPGPRAHTPPIPRIASLRRHLVRPAAGKSRNYGQRGRWKGRTGNSARATIITIVIAAVIVVISIAGTEFKNLTDIDACTGLFCTYCSPKKAVSPHSILFVYSKKSQNVLYLVCIKRPVSLRQLLQHIRTRILSRIIKIGIQNVRCTCTPPIGLLRMCRRRHASYDCKQSQKERREQDKMTRN